MDKHYLNSLILSIVTATVVYDGFSLPNGEPASPASGAPYANGSIIVSRRY